MRELSTILWHERGLVQAVARGTAARGALHAAELDRAVVVSSLVEALDLDDDVTLRDLAALLPAPWDGVFGSHHAALAGSVAGTDLPRSLADFLR